MDTNLDENLPLEVISDRREVFKRIGRNLAERELGVSSSSISNAIRDGIPGNWFGTLEPLCRQRGFEIDRCIFNWKRAEDVA